LFNPKKGMGMAPCEKPPVNPLANPPAELIPPINPPIPFLPLVELVEASVEPMDLGGVTELDVEEELEVLEVDEAVGEAVREEGMAAARRA
jgi:hypothetical protein